VDLITLAAGDATLTLAPELGASIVAWERGRFPMFRPPLPDALERRFVRGLAAFPLVPYSNRIVHGRFRFAGSVYALPATFGGHAIHGVGWETPWRLVARKDESVLLAMTHVPNEFWPFAFDAELLTTLTPDRLSVRIEAVNRHDAPAPFGIGLHPYFPRSAAATLQFNADGVWRNSREMEPVAHIDVPPEWDHTLRQPLGSAALDNCFTGWDGTARLSYPHEGYVMTIAAEPVFGNLVVYDAPDNPFIAAEPVSNANDAINKPDLPAGQAMRVLAPGETLAGTMSFTVEDVAA
jgi:aldose 1-epimerase